MYQKFEVWRIATQHHEGEESENWLSPPGCVSGFWVGESARDVRFALMLFRKALACCCIFTKALNSPRLNRVTEEKCQRARDEKVMESKGNKAGETGAGRTAFAMTKQGVQ